MARSVGCGVLGMGLLLSGCIDSSTLIQVAKDGSGTIEVADYLGPEAMGMMAGFDEMTTAMGAPGSDRDELAGLPVILRGMVEGRLADFGDAVRLVRAEEVVNAEGWKGYKALFAFDDIRQVQVSMGSNEDGVDGVPAAFRVEFTPGDVAELRLISDAPPDEPGIDAEELGDMADMVTALGEGMETAMLSMFEGLFKGMRMQLAVEVQGRILETNAARKESGPPNRIPLFEVDMDALMQHPGAFSQLMKDRTQSVQALQAEGITGLFSQEPGQAITIQFQ